MGPGSSFLPPALPTLPVSVGTALLRLGVPRAWLLCTEVSVTMQLQ